jgi:hypothetical protein
MNLDEAMESHATLREYDATSAQRNKVIDLKGDFISYEGQEGKWLSKSEIERAKQVQQKRADAYIKLDKRNHSYDLDLTNLRLTTSAEIKAPDSFADELSDENQKEEMRVQEGWFHSTLKDEEKNFKHDHRAEESGAFMNPLLDDRPIYVNRKETRSKRINGEANKRSQSKGQNVAKKP